MGRRIRVSFDIELGPRHSDRTIMVAVKPALELAVKQALVTLRGKVEQTRVEKLPNEQREQS